MCPPGALSRPLHNNPVALGHRLNVGAGCSDFECSLIPSHRGRFGGSKSGVEWRFGWIHSLDLIDVRWVQRRSQKAEIDLGAVGRRDGMLVKAGSLATKYNEAIISHVQISFTNISTYRKTSFGSPYLE